MENQIRKSDSEVNAKDLIIGFLYSFLVSLASIPIAFLLAFSFTIYSDYGVLQGILISFLCIASPFIVLNLISFLTIHGKSHRIGFLLSCAFWLLIILYLVFSSFL